MNCQTVPDRSVVVTELIDLTRLLYHALEAGTLEASRYFEQKGRQHDPWLYASLVRSEARDVLTKQGYLVNVIPEDVVNNGLCMEYLIYRIRILKAAEGQALPIPGSSLARQEFYGQAEWLRLPLPNLPPELAPPRRLNLVYLWDVTAAHRLSLLTLVCPRSGRLNRTSVREYWREVLPHVGFVGPAVSPMERDLLDDLDITALDEHLQRQTGILE